MPTTNPSIGRSVLSVLHDTGVDFALLQNPLVLSQETPTGDIDIVVDRPAREALLPTLDALASKEIHLVALWPYDVGGTATAFFLGSDGASGAQIDLLHDPDGLGHYHLRSSVLLEQTERAEPFPMVSPRALSIYRFSKRTRKGQEERLRSIRAEIQIDAEFRNLVSRLVTSPSLGRAIGGPEQRVRRSSLGTLGISHLRRVRSRFARPVGFWIHLSEASHESAVGLAHRFGAVLVRAEVSAPPLSTVRSWWWYWRVVQPVRLRPGIIVSTGPLKPGAPSPDLIIDDTASLAARTVRAMASRFRAT